MKSFIFLKLYIFEYLLFFECLILEIDSKYNLQQFTKWCFTLWFYNVIKAIGKRKKEDGTLLTLLALLILLTLFNSVTIMISVDGKGTFFSVRLKLDGQSFE